MPDHDKDAEKAQCEVRACREFTVVEMLEQQIGEAERKLKALIDLKASLPGSYLTSPCSRFAFAVSAFK